METIALKIAQYDFTDKKGISIKTDKYIVALGDFGFKEICSSKGNDIPLLTKVKVVLEVKNNKLSIKSIEK